MISLKSYYTEYEIILYMIPLYLFEADVNSAEIRRKPATGAGVFRNPNQKATPVHRDERGTGELRAGRTRLVALRTVTWPKGRVGDSLF
ncbi:unnamed protein product [Strongylus vulgaris]|uniref:Uncharacterized protein n=1 Tax=Strongylus vulgaris TaxID=40348 RepID=A0A3P7JVC0_STRVU|nr:unnamed protein product [Strongylus vulgaris]